MRTEEIIRKADMAIGDFQGAGKGGVLNPMQTDQFIRKLIASPTMLGQIRTVPMVGSQMKINKIGFGTRIMRPAVSATALLVADRAKPTTSQILLNTKEIIAEVRMPYDVIEDVIERGSINAGGPSQVAQPVEGNFKDTIVSMIIERCALDVEELILLGDTGSGDAYLALIDGYLKRASAHVVNFGGQPINKSLFKLGLQSMPIQFLRNMNLMKHYLATSQEINYRDTLASRETTLGDSIIEGTRPVYGFGVPLEKTSLMPLAQGLLTYPQNLIVGVQRKISIEVAKDITERVFIIVVTMRLDAQIEETDAAVQYTTIG
jgi:hypothetical protein